MQTEFETKVLDINVEEIKQRLSEVGAILKEPETLMKRRVFDIQAHENGSGKRFRLRQKGNKTTLTYKERNGSEIGSTKELETGVENFEDMAEILKKLPRNISIYQENKRTIYTLGEVEICIDARPMIPPYLEIEGPNTESVKEVLTQLQLEGKDEGDMGVIEVYKEYEIDLHSYPELKFEE